MIKKPSGPGISEPVKRILSQLIDEINDMKSIIVPLTKERDKRIVKAKAKQDKILEAEAEDLAKQIEIDAAKKVIADAEAKKKAESEAKAKAKADAEAEAKELAAAEKLLKEQKL